MVDLNLAGHIAVITRSFFTSRLSMLGLEESDTPAATYSTGSMVIIDASLSLELGRPA